MVYSKLEAFLSGHISYLSNKNSTYQLNPISITNRNANNSQGKDDISTKLGYITSRRLINYVIKRRMQCRVALAISADVVRFATADMAIRAEVAFIGIEVLNRS